MEPNRDVKESDIRPHELFQEYLNLSAQDAITYFPISPRNQMNCPACEDIGAFAFSKSGFAYRECTNCATVWVSPRPSKESFSTFYSDSPSSRYWAEVFSPAVEDVRRLKLWMPKAQKVQELIMKLEPEIRNVVDLGGGTGLFAQEFALVSNCNVVVVEPNPQAAAQCADRDIQVIQAFSEDLDESDLPSGPTLFTSFELFEHVFDPLLWLTKLAEIMKSGDFLLVTTLSGIGLDIRLLWERSASLSPPHHINFLNPSSMHLIAKRADLEMVEVTTPGVLDIDIVANNLAHIDDHFWKFVCEQLSDAKRREWQQLLSSSGLSSHMWAIMRKP